jgi:hypothetical protein
MTRKFKVYKQDKEGSKSVLVTEDYVEACRKEKEINEQGGHAFVWEV